MKTVLVDASKKYEVIIGRDLISGAGELIREAARKHGSGAASDARGAVIVSDDNVFPLYGEKLRESLERSGFKTVAYVVPHGEKSKSMACYEELLNMMCAEHITRSDIAVSLGGGVVGDLAGFAAATYQRGIGLVQMPTSLLSAVDSSVGGKTGINLDMGKNQVGSFYQPMLVICSTDTLDTLPENEYRNGCAEIIKYAMIGSGDMLRDITARDVREDYEDIIAKCVAMKRDYVVRDEFDVGERMMLNFGHTIGHAVETESGYSVFHGEAVAIGMAAITREAVARGICRQHVLDALLEALRRYRLPEKTGFSGEKLAEIALNDKKSTGKTIRLVVPEDIGRCTLYETARDEMPGWINTGE